jgi:CNT family concentrative nucleoside transporter
VSATLLQVLHGLFGLCVLLGIAWLLSEIAVASRRGWSSAGLRCSWRSRLLLLKLPPAQGLFVAVNEAVLAVQRATEVGTSFVFGYLGGGDAPFETAYPENSFVLAFRALPLVLVIGALSALLFHWRVLPCWCGYSPGCCATRSASAAHLAWVRRPMSSSAWSSRRC